jgi:hypothetical protein
MFKKLFQPKKADLFTVACRINLKLPSKYIISADELCSALAQIPYTIYGRPEIKSRWYWRLTLPVLFVVVIVGYIFSPIHFIFTGTWYYNSKTMQVWIEKVFN